MVISVNVTSKATASNQQGYCVLKGGDWEDDSQLPTRMIPGVWDRITEGWVTVKKTCYQPHRCPVPAGSFILVCFFFSFRLPCLLAPELFKHSGTMIYAVSSFYQGLAFICNLDIRGVSTSRFRFWYNLIITAHFNNDSIFFFNSQWPAHKSDVYELCQLLSFFLFPFRYFIIKMSHACNICVFSLVVIQCL